MAWPGTRIRPGRQKVGSLYLESVGKSAPDAGWMTASVALSRVDAPPAGPVDDLRVFHRVQSEGNIDAGPATGRQRGLHPSMCRAVPAGLHRQAVRGDHTPGARVQMSGPLGCCRSRFLTRGPLSPTIKKEVPARFVIPPALKHATLCVLRIYLEASSWKSRGAKVYRLRRQVCHSCDVPGEMYT